MVFFKKNKIFFLSLFLSLFLLPSISFAFGNLSDSFSSGRTKYSAQKMGFKSYDSVQTPETVVGVIISTILGFLGVIFGILIIYGGFLWMTAGGNDQEVDKAKNIIKNAAIGLLVVLLSYSLSWLVLNIFVSSGPEI